MEIKSLAVLKHKEEKKILLLCSLVGMFEFYDFIIYVLLAHVLAELYFPFENPNFNLLSAFFTFSLGYLARPLGSVFFGRIGEIIGRKKTLIFMFLTMFFSTLLVGLLPTYAKWGISSTLLLIIFRVLQGMAIGKEIPGSITYIAEYLPDKKGLATAFILFFLASGMTIGAFMHWLLWYCMSKEAFLLWGWRLLFFLGSLFSIVSFLLWRSMRQSPFFCALAVHVNIPLRHMLLNDLPSLILGIIVVGSGAILFTELFLFMQPYLDIVVHYKPHHFLLLNVVGYALASLCILFFGYLSDHYNKYNLFCGCIFIAALLSVFIFYACLWHMYYITVFLGAIAYGSVWGIIPSILADLFHKDTRFSGVAISYSVGFFIFAGVVPFLSIYLAITTGYKQAPGFFIAVLLLFLCMYIYETMGDVARNFHYTKLYRVEPSEK